jgi:hypothetical protein
MTSFYNKVFLITDKEEKVSDVKIFKNSYRIDNEKFILES